jgi:hypothetical protein
MQPRTPDAADVADLWSLNRQLEAVGVHDAEGLHATLLGLGLRTVADLALLRDEWVAAELDATLRDHGHSLGDRAKVRRRWRHCQFGTSIAVFCLVYNNRIRHNHN